MGYRCAFIFVLFLALGCTEADKVQWNKAMDDLNYKNMEMQNNSSSMKADWDDGTTIRRPTN